jgi:hypothetical protein
MGQLYLLDMGDDLSIAPIDRLVAVNVWRMQLDTPPIAFDAKVFQTLVLAFRVPRGGMEKTWQLCSAIARIDTFSDIVTVDFTQMNYVRLCFQAVKSSSAFRSALRRTY